MLQPDDNMIAGLSPTPLNVDTISMDTLIIDSTKNVPDDLSENLSFDDLPLFPENVPLAPLLRVSLSRLSDRDVAEEEKLWRACCDLGFFYLDLRQSGPGKSNDENVLDRRDSGHASANPITSVNVSLSVSGKNDNDGTQADVDQSSIGKAINGPDLLTDVEDLFHLGRDLFALPLEEKQRYDFASRGSYFGYKGLGGGIVDADGTRDGNEFYNVSKDDILRSDPEEEPLPAPDLLRDDKNRALLENYIRHSHAIVTLILERLNERLCLPHGTLASLHRIEEKSGDQVRFIRAPPRSEMDQREMSMGQHTDFGSVTLLFNRLGGLQVLPPFKALATAENSPGGSDVIVETASWTGATPSTPEWCYVKPLRGHCIVNLGDALVKFTAGVLRSNLHRVVTPPGSQAHCTRTSLVYFARPEDSVLLQTLQGSPVVDQQRRSHVEFAGEEVVTAKEWILRRGLGRRTGGDFDASKGTEDVRA